MSKPQRRKSSQSRSKRRETTTGGASTVEQTQPDETPPSPAEHKAVSSVELVVSQETMEVVRDNAPITGIFLADMPTDAIDPRERSGFMDAIESRESLGRIPVIAGYRIVRILATGGMGTVFEAEQNNPKRRVALKIIRADLGNPDIYRRFEHEANVLGLLQHPGIAQIFEAGTFDLGDGPQPYIAMEFVQGRPLMQFIAKENPDLRARLEILAQVCEAVQHAHQKRVIHRDLKPDNILVTAGGLPKIVDFGVARAVESEQRAGSSTRSGVIIGTINYMSPEQIEGKSDDVDTRSDIYSLGVIAYQLLAGRLPHDMSNMTLSKAAHQVREVEPAPLSRLDRAFRGDIETIVAKALEKKPDRRYQNASDMAADIRRFLADEPIVARPPSAAYQLRKFAKRNRAVVFAGIGLVAILFASILSASYQAEMAMKDRSDALQAEAQSERMRRIAEQLRAESEQARAESEEARRQAEAERLRADEAAERARAEADSAERVSEVLMDLLAVYNQDPDRTAAVSPREMLDQALRGVTESLQKDPLLQARLIGVIGRAYRSIGLGGEAVSAYQKQLALLEGALSPNSPEVIAATAELAEAEASAGQWSAASDTIGRAFNLARSRKPRDNREVEQLMARLADILRRQADHENRKENLQKSEMLYRHLLAIVKTRGGSESLDYAEFQEKLADVFIAQGQKDGMVEQLLRDSIALRGRIEERPSLAIAIAMNNLAGLLTRRNENSEAESLYERSWLIRDNLFGADHPESAEALFTYADFLRTRQNQPDRAIPHYRRVYESTLNLYGPNSLRLAVREWSLALALWQTGDEYEWAQYMREALDIIARRRGTSDSRYAQYADGYVKRLLMKGRIEEAATFTTALVKGRDRDFGTEHPAYAAALELQAQVLWVRGERDRATSLRGEAARIRETASAK